MSPHHRRLGGVTALAFAGQGQRAGAALVGGSPAARAVLARVDRALGYDLSRLITRPGPHEALGHAKIAQPALVTAAVADAEQLVRAGARPSFLVGHSLGQYAALVVAGALQLEDAVHLVGLRGELMQRAVPPGRGAMAAVSGLTADEVAQCCADAAHLGVVSIACYNGPEHHAISGCAEAVAFASDLCFDAGGGVLPLDVTSPFHCALLAPMVPAFRAAVARVPVARPRIPVVDNVSGAPVFDPDDVRASLVAHVVAPVRFDACVAFLARSGVDQVVQCGPGGLAKLVRACDPQIRALTAEQWVNANDPGTRSVAVDPGTRRVAVDPATRRVAVDPATRSVAVDPRTDVDTRLMAV